MEENDKLLLIVGHASAGKTRSLKHISNPESVAYFNADAKPTSFKNNFAVDVRITQPNSLFNYLDECERNKDIKIIIIDTITHLMRTFKILNIDEASDSRAGWGKQQAYYNKLMLKLKSSAKSIIVIAHVSDEQDDVTESTVSKIVFQGAIAKAPISDYTTVLEAKSVKVTKKFIDIKNKLFDINEYEKEDGIKYLFVTRRTKANPITMARSADDLWERNELYINNDVQKVIDRLSKYYD